MAKPFYYFAFTLLVGCGNAAPSEPGARDRPATRTLEQQSTSVVHGYQHVQSTSLFDVGPNATTANTSGFEQIVGDHGVFSRRVSTGFIAALPNSDAPCRTRPALTNVGDEHNAQVLSYFVARGLPPEQVATVTAHATMHQTGSSAELLGPNKPTPVFDWYSSVLARAIDGFPVPDSFAWARFNVDGVAVSESVFWPDIPASVLADAQQLQLVVTSGGLRDFLSPETASKAFVAIRHSSGTYDGPFVATATIDAPADADLGHVRHFDASGVEVHVPGNEPSPGDAR